jgi:hypothetical protein
MAASSPQHNAGDRIILVTIILLLLLLVVFVVALINISNTFQNQPGEYKASEASRTEVPQVTIKPAPAKSIAPPVSIAFAPVQEPKNKPPRRSKAPAAAAALRKKQPTKSAAITPTKRPSQPKPTNQKVIRPAPPIPESSYLKLGANGQVLPHSATEWACVQDRATGLMWEVKTNDNSLRDRDNFYSWYDPARERNHGEPGYRDGGRCKGKTDCDTLAYVEAINTQRLCGYSDWRLPRKEELLSLIQYANGRTESQATIDAQYFPQTAPSWYWTASSNPNKPDYAWFVLFRNGLALNALKHHPKHIRLVRSRTVEKKTLSLAFNE